MPLPATPASTTRTARAAALAGTDSAATAADVVRKWETQPHSENPYANALRWGTLYNFRFKSKRAPVYPSTITIDLFKTGTPSSVTGVSVAPAAAASPVGACCVPGACTVRTQICCNVAGGAFKGANTDCRDCALNGAPDACEFGYNPVRACCFTGGYCELRTATCCALDEGIFRPSCLTCACSCPLDAPQPVEPEP